MSKNLQEMTDSEFTQEACDVVHHLANNFLLYAVSISRTARVGESIPTKFNEAVLFYGLRQVLEGLGNTAESIGMETPETDWTAAIYHEMHRRAEVYDARFEKPKQEPTP